MTTSSSLKIDLHNDYPGGRSKAWLAWSMPALFFLYEFMIRVSPGVIEGDLQTQFKVSTSEIGFSMSMYYYAYAPMQLVVGLLLDRLGGRWPMAIAALVCAMGCFMFAVAGGMTGLGTARFLMGFGSAFAYVGTIYVGSIWFPGRRIALLSGVTAALGMLGAVSAEALLGVLLEAVTWREAFNIFAIVAVAIAVLMWMLIPRNPSWYTEQVRHARDTHGCGILSGMACVLRNRQTWMLALVTALVYLPIGTFAALWGVRYLEVAMGFSSDASGPAVSMMFVGLGVVGPMVGWLSDRQHRRSTYLRLGTLVGLVCSAGLLVIPENMPWLVYVLLLLLGGSAGTVVVAFPLAMEHNPHHSRGTAMTFVNFTQMILAGFGQWLIGGMLDSGASTGKSIEALDGSDFKKAFLILPAALLLSVLVAWFLRDPENKADEQNALLSTPLAD